MKNFCNRMVRVLYLAVLSSFAYATKNYTARNATAVVQFVAVAANITVKNTTNNTTVSPLYSPKFHKTKARAWLQSRVNGTLPNATKLVAQGRNATSGYQGQPSGAGKKGGRNKSTGRRGRTETPEPVSRKEGRVDECFIAKPSSGKQDKESYRPNSRDARRGYADGNSVARGDSGNGQAKESDIPVKKVGDPMAKSLLPAKLPRLQRNTPALPPPPPEPVPVGNANFTSILGQSHDGHFHLVEPVNLSNQHTPFHNATEPFSGELDGRGHAITGLNKPLFGAIDGSHLDLVLDTPNVTGNPAGAVASQMGSNNDVKVKVIDGSVTCNGTGNCYVGLIGGEVQGNYNYIEQYDSTGQVRATETLSDHFFDSGGRHIASLSLGSVKGDGNTLVQSNTSGSAIANAHTGTFTNDSGESSRTTNGTVVVAAVGPGYMAGDGNTVIQERVEANMTSIVAGAANRVTPGVVTGVQSLAGLGAGIVEGDQFTLGQTDVKGHIEAQASGHSSILDSNCHYDDICPNDTYTDSIVRGVQAVATVGVAEMKGDFPQVTQIDAEGQLGANVSNTEVINHYNPNNTVPAAAYRGAVVGRYDSVGGLLQLYSGNVGENIPVVGDMVGGYYAAESDIRRSSFIDRSGYTAGESSGIGEFHTTEPISNVHAWSTLCFDDDIYNCEDGRSCHYVHEMNPSLVWLPNGDLALMSQQSYPYGSEADNANGVFRVIQFKAANGTNGADSAGDALPQLNENVGFFGTTVYETEVPQRKRLSLPVSQHANTTHIHNLYERNEGIKIASFPIAKTGSSEASITTTYHTVDFNVPGQPLLLSDNGFSVWMINGTSTINRYHYDGLNQLNSKTSFHLESLHEGSSRVLAIGHNSDWLYVARYLDDNQIMIVRSSLVNRLPDPNFMLTLNTPGTGIDYQLIVDEHHNVLLLPRGTVHMALEPDNGNTNGPGTSYRDNDGNIITALKADLPGTGGCVNWKIVQAHSIQATAPPHVTAVVPNPSSRTLLSTVNQMTTKMSSLAVTSTPVQAPGVGSDAGSGVSIVEIAVPVATGVTLVGVGTAAGVYCTFKMIKRKRKLADSEAISLGVISKNEGATDTDV